MLMAVRVRQLQSFGGGALRLGREFSGDISGVDASGRGTEQELPIRKGKRPATVDQRRHLARGKNGWVLTDEREVQPNVEARGRVQHRDSVLDLTRDSEQRGGGNHPVQMSIADTPVDPTGEPEIIRIDYQEASRHQGRSEWSSGCTDLSSPRSWLISRTILRITAGLDSVEMPRVRGK